MSVETERNGLESDDTEAMEEAIHFTRVIKAFRKYKADALVQIARSEKSFMQLPESHRLLLPDHLEILDKMKTCIEHNSVICHLIAKTCEKAFQNKTFEEMKEDILTQPRPMDLDKVRTTLKQIVRDWSAEGEEERDMCYRPMIAEISSRLPLVAEKGQKSSVLVPGCGLGRLAWELARLGYRCEGNEFSFFMLFTSDFILNRTPYSSNQDFHKFTVHPWVTQKCNIPSWESALAPVKFPDVNPAVLPPDSQFSMAAGDFLECYEIPNSWDCVATCYFIDTAHNVISYIERIYKILSPEGLWINMGPLLYHFCDMLNESSVEFSYEQIIEIVRKIGFEIIKDERGVPSTYIDNPNSMLQYRYKCGFLVAKKPKSIS